MFSRRSPDNARNTLSMKLGGWFEAHATGWGVIAVPIVIGLIGGLALLRWLAG
jgi:hypothetical protein